MGSFVRIHRPPRSIVQRLLLAAYKSRAMVPDLLEHGLEALFTPATAALVAANVLVHFSPGPLDRILPSEDDVVFRFQQPGQLKALLSSFYHVSLDHLFGNMSCLLQTGAALESAMGTANYASMVATLAGLSHGITALLCKGVMALLELDDGDDDDEEANHESYDYTSIGFSGIIFAMETVLSCSRTFAAFEIGILCSTRVPAEYAVLLIKSARVLRKLAMCADLFVVQAMIPEADFIGHLGGLLAGFVYHLLKRSLKGADPLAWLMSRGVRSLSLAATRAQEHQMSSAILSNIIIFIKYCCSSVTAMTAAAGGGGDGGRRREYPRGIWTCSTCNNYNSLATDTCEMCSTMREDCAFSGRRWQLASSSSRLLVRC